MRGARSTGSATRRGRAACALALAALGFLVPVAVRAQDAAPSNAAFQTLRYSGVPLAIEMQAGVESMLRFPWRPTPGFRSEMIGELDIVTIGDTTFITPQSAFEDVEFKFRNAADGTIIATRISAREDAAPVALDIRDARAELAAARRAPAGPRGPAGRDVDPAPASAGADYGYVALARFAFQQVYAPERLQEPLPGMRAQRLRGTPESRADRDLFPGRRVVAMPWAEWRAPTGLYVTAVYLENLSDEPIRIDPRRLRYDPRVWKGLSFYAGSLGAASDPSRVTTMVVISSAPWRQAMAAFRPDR